MKICIFQYYTVPNELSSSPFFNPLYSSYSNFLHVVPMVYGQNLDNFPLFMVTSLLFKKLQGFLWSAKRLDVTLILKWPLKLINFISFWLFLLKYRQRQEKSEYQ